jgi:hypothetical protein
MIKLEDETQIAGDGVTDDSAALAAVINSAAPGEVIKGKRGAVYWLSGNSALPDRGIPLPDVHIDPNRCTFAFAFSQAGTYGFRPLSKAKIWGEGTIKTAVSQNSTPQAIDHAPIGIGCMYGDDGPMNVVNPYLAPRGIKIGGGLSIETVKPDGSLIQIFGAPEDWLFEDLYFPDSAFMGLGIGADWVTRGNGTSNQAEMYNNLQKFNNGQFYTIHPGFGTIRRVFAGKMTNTNHRRQDGGPTIVRLSATNDVEVDTVHAKLAAAIGRCTAGDLGREFAPEADKSRANKGNSFRRMMLDCHSGLNPGMMVDSNADNVERSMTTIQNGSGEVYSPLLKPIGVTDIIVRDSTVVRTAESLTLPQRAFLATQVDGAKFENCNSVGCWVGVHADDAADNVEIKGGLHEGTTGASVLIHGTIAPKGAWVESVRAVRSGQGGGNVGAIELGNCVNPRIKSNIIGVEGDPLEGAAWGIHATDSCIGYVIDNDNKILQVRPSTNWPAISCGSTESVGKGRVANNYVAAGLVPYGGAAIILMLETHCYGGISSRLFMALAGAVNASGPLPAFNPSYFKNGDCFIIGNSTSPSAKMMQKVNGSWVTY